MWDSPKYNARFGRIGTVEEDSNQYRTKKLFGCVHHVSSPCHRGLPCCWVSAAKQPHLRSENQMSRPSDDVAAAKHSVYNVKGKRETSSNSKISVCISSFFIRSVDLMILNTRRARSFTLEWASLLQTRPLCPEGGLWPKRYFELLLHVSIVSDYFNYFSTLI